MGGNWPDCDTSTTGIYLLSGNWSAPKPEPRPDHGEALAKRLHCRVGWRRKARCRPARAGRKQGAASVRGGIPDV